MQPIRIGGAVVRGTTTAEHYKPDGPYQKPMKKSSIYYNP